MNFENGELNVRRTIGTGDLWSGGTARRSGRTVASMRMVMHSHLLNAGLSVPGRIGVIAVDAADESHSSSLQECKRNHECDGAANNHQVILSRAS